MQIRDNKEYKKYYYNSATISGKILSIEFSHIVKGTKYYNGYLYVERNHENSDVICFTITDNQLELYKNQLKVGSYIKLKGELRSYYITIYDKKKLQIALLVRNVLPFETEEGFINEIEMVGHICRNSYLKTLKNGRSILSVLISTSKYASKTNCIPVVIWDKKAEEHSKDKYGTIMYIKGRLQSRNFIKRTQIEDKSDIETFISYEVSSSKYKYFEEPTQPEIIDCYYEEFESCKDCPNISKCYPTSSFSSTASNASTITNIDSNENTNTNTNTNNDVDLRTEESESDILNQAFAILSL